MGDFNTDLLAHHSPRARKLLDIISSSSLHVLPLQATHHNLDACDTWLDLILTSAPSLVSCHGQYLAPGFSHHDLLFLSYTLKPPKFPPKVLHIRCFGRMNLDNLQKDAAALNWDDLTEATSVDVMVNVFNKKIINLFDAHAPIKRVKLKRPPAPWLTAGIRMAMRLRDHIFRKYKKDRTQENWTCFKVARNRCNQMIRNAKRRHILANISLSSPANVWKFLGTLGIGKKHHSDSSCLVGLDSINNFFTSSSPLDHQTKSLTINYISNLARPHIPPFDFSPVALSEIKTIILSIKSNAMGCDAISRRMIILILDHLLPAISCIINFSLFSCAFPSQWRKAFVIPLPKTSNPSLPNHYRPISLLPFLSKVLEACVHKQLSSFVYKNNLLSPFQSGFRPGHSTTSALLKVTGDIRTGMEDGKVTVLTLVDFSNAFCSVDHDILLAILSHLMISPKALEWFSTYLQGRQQSVRLDESSSSWRGLNSGVPQGGILSPLLFSIFIDLITQNLQCSYHLYADDLQLYAQARVSCVNDAIDLVNRDLESIKSWSNKFGVSVNPNKCQYIIIGSSRMISRLDTSVLHPIIYDGSVIVPCPEVKNLGLHIDATLSWQPQVCNVSQKVTGTLRALYRLKNFLSSKTKIMLVQSLVLPIIDYGDVCYFDLNADLLNKLDRLLNNCIRYIFNLRKYDHVSSFRSELRWLPIRQRRNQRALTTLHSILTFSSPPTYLTPYFQYLCTTHSKDLRSSNNLLLSCPSHTTDFVHSSFPVQSILLWNALPAEIRMCVNRYTFKLKVRELLLNRAEEFL